MPLTTAPSLPGLESRTASPSPSASLSPSPSLSLTSGAAKRRRARALARSRQAAAAEQAVLGRYVAAGRLREVLTRPGAAGSVLVVDRDVATDGEERLVAHLGADEPLGNAALACRDYLRYPSHRWCRPVTAEDLVVTPFGERSHEVAGVEHPSGHTPTGTGRQAAEAGRVVEVQQGAAFADAAVAPPPVALHDGDGYTYRLGPAEAGVSLPQLRWHRLSAGSGVPVPVGLREVVGVLECYEPVRTLTVSALDRHQGERVSTYTLRAELARLDGSRIVLNRGLREAVVAAIASGAVSMSEITVRCGRVKRRGGAPAGGDTSWLARRVGLAPEGGRGGRPTPWVHSEVLALIARRGLGISPREVELG
jgi:hypothetical protein